MMQVLVIFSSSGRIRLPTHGASFRRHVCRQTERRSVLANCASRHCPIHTGHQDDIHCDAEPSGVILLKFRRCLHGSADDGCVFYTHTHIQFRQLLINCRF